MQPFPVEYKRGRLRNEVVSRFSFAQRRFGLEEMLSIQVFAGALYYGKAGDGKEVPLTIQSETKLR